MGGLPRQCGRGVLCLVGGSAAVVLLSRGCCVLWLAPRGDLPQGHTGPCPPSIQESLLQNKTASGASSGQVGDNLSLENKD